MGIIVSRYMDPQSSEGALVKFIIESLTLVRTLCTADTTFPELTPWNVIDFHSEDLSDTFSLSTFFSPQTPSRLRDDAELEDAFVDVHHAESTCEAPPPFDVEYDECITLLPPCIPSVPDATDCTQSAAADVVVVFEGSEADLFYVSPTSILRDVRVECI